MIVIIVCIEKIIQHKCYNKHIYNNETNKINDVDINSISINNVRKVFKSNVLMFSLKYSYVILAI